MIEFSLVWGDSLKSISIETANEPFVYKVV